MKSTRYSMQREVILKNVLLRKDHPTAEKIYEDVREAIPNISLGTVYRNLSGLADNGMIKKLSFGESMVHFDGDTSVHSHFYCEVCGSINDIRLDTTPLLDTIVNELGVNIKFADFNIVGQCKNCCKKNSN